MNFELFVARRVRLKSDKPQSKTPSTTIAVAGVALAIIIMMIAIVVVLGFKHEIRDKVMGFDAQLTILPTTGYGETSTGAYVQYSDTLQQIISSAIPHAKMSLTMRQPGILKTDDNFAGVIIKGMDTGYDWKFIKDNLVKGEIPDYEDYEATKNKIIISQTTASSLKLSVGDKIYAYFFRDNNIRTRRFEVAAIYESHFGEYDKLMAFSSITMLQKLAGLSESQGASLEIRNLNHDAIIDEAATLQENLMQSCYSGQVDRLYHVDNVYRSGALYFNWLDLLDTNVVVILILMAFVSGFTLISSMFIIILERINMIGVMKSLGATNKQIRKIFIYLTERLVLKGMIIGNVVALILIFLQKKYKLLPLDPEAYYLNYVPIEINLWHILLLNAGVLIISCAILILPSYLISTISPSKTIRIE